MNRRWCSAAQRLRALSLLLTTAAVSDRAPPSPQQRFGEVQQRLAAEKMLLEALGEQKLGALEALDLLQERALRSASGAQQLERAISPLEDLLNSAQAQELAARNAVDQELTRLEPRLVLLYRLLRHRPLELIASARDVYSVLWRSRHVASIIDQDLALLGAVKRIENYQRVTIGKLRALRDVLDWAREVAQRQTSEAAVRRASWTQLLASIEADERKSNRLLVELQEAEKELFRLVQRLPRQVAPTGFEALKGRLPYPTSGIIEVGFGKVVNPKFNTITFQKGVDIHAGKGTLVRAVASGRVVFAGWLRGYGNLLIVDHGDRYHTLVAHLESFSRKVGDLVQLGEELGRVGDSGSVKGPYLYFEIRKAGDAVDPAAWLSP